MSQGRCFAAGTPGPLLAPESQHGAGSCWGPCTAQTLQDQRAGSPICTYSPVPELPLLHMHARVHTHVQTHARTCVRAGTCKCVHTQNRFPTCMNPFSADISWCRRVSQLGHLWSPLLVDNPRQRFLNLLDIPQAL